MRLPAPFAAAIIASAATIAYVISRPAIGSFAKRLKFRARNAPFVRQLPRLRRVINSAVDRQLANSTEADELVHLFVRRAVDDFEEILILAANGHSLGAIGNLRAMYERVVTTFHIQNNPEEAEQFLDYHWIQRKKMLNVLDDSIEHNVTPEVRELIYSKYEEVKGKFIVELCKSCGLKDVNFRWHKWDFVTMAKKVGVQGLRDLLFRAYYLPMEQTHATAGSLLFQLQEDGGQLSLRHDVDATYADHAVASAHLLVMFAAASLCTQLKLSDVEAALEVCVKDHSRAWRHLP